MSRSRPVYQRSLNLLSRVLIKNGVEIMSWGHIRFSIFAWLFLGYSTFVMAHGESKYGPNGGFIRMPGRFHTELVPSDDPRVYRVFLLDMAFKNPTTSGSTVTLSYSGHTPAEAKCFKKNKFFECKFERKIDVSSGSMTLTAQRSHATATPAEYPLPLRLFNGPPQ